MKENAESQRDLVLKLEQWIKENSEDGPQPYPDWPHFKETLRRYHLVNPRASHWITADGAQLVVTQPDSVRLVRNAASSLLGLLHDGQVSRVVQLFALPDFFNPASLQAPDARSEMKWKWERVRKQLQEFIRLLGKEPRPAWLEELKQPDAKQWLMLALHSLVFHPANWHYPIWLDDYGAVLADDGGGRYSHASDDAECRVEWTRRLVFLLRNRGALLRLATGEGGNWRVTELAQGLRARLSDAWAARLLVEYLDSCGDTSTCTTANEIWHDLEKRDFDATGIEAKEPAATLQAETVGHQAVKKRFEQSGHGAVYERLLELFATELGSPAEGLYRAASTWLVFDAEEIRKRWSDLQKGIARLPTTPTLKDFPLVIPDEVLPAGAQNVRVVRVGPDKRLTLKNRLPEVTRQELSKIADRKFSAASLFDTLLLDKQASPAREPLWMPRVYRILDSMEALDPGYVQKISVFLDSGEFPLDNPADEFSGGVPLSKFVAYLPLPRTEGEQEHQPKRKEFLARYVATHIYNCAVVRRLRGARFECADVAADHGKYALDDDELERLIADAEEGYHLRPAYGHYVECVNFDPFRLQPGPGDAHETSDFVFSVAEMREQGFFLGVDIGGTDVKACLFQKGGPASGSFVKIPLLRFKTFEKERDNDCTKFFARIVEGISRGLFKNPSEAWPQILAAGLSWPGAARASRVVGTSGSLGRLTFNGKTVAWESPPGEIHRLNLLRTFRQALDSFAEGLNVRLDPTFACVLVNDGDAEALGNYCLQRLSDAADPRPPGRAIVIKLGTSLAGGRIDARGAIADDVAEFSKPVLDLNAPQPGRPTGATRNYISSLGVRKLSREFNFRNQLLFGEKDGANADDQLQTRIEAIELGLLLLLWRSGDPGRQWLKCLSETNNQPSPEQGSVLEGWAETPEGRKAVSAYIRELGGAWQKRQRASVEAEAGCLPALRHVVAKFAGPDSPDTGSVPNATTVLDAFHEGRIWCQGLERAWWLCSRDTMPDPDTLCPNEIPDEFPYERLSEVAQGSAALFSQLALQIAHLIALLYNIYRRGTFTRVILAGGVLSGETGELVRDQTAAFLEKFYDKICPSHLPREEITLAQPPEGFDRESVGPFGAAMAANRQHKLAALGVMRRRLEKLVHEKASGETVDLAKAQQLCSDVRVDQTSIGSFLQNLAAQGVLAPTSNNSYRKV